MTDESTQAPRKMSKELFERNLEAWREYIIQKGAYFDEHGCLCYGGVELTPSDEEFFGQNSGPYEEIFDEKNFEAAWDWLLFISRDQFYKANLVAWLQFLDHNGLPVVNEYEWVSWLDKRPPKTPKEYLSQVGVEVYERLLTEREFKELLKDILNNASAGGE